jgi:hypothetical protein
MVLFSSRSFRIILHSKSIQDDILIASSERANLGECDWTPAIELRTQIVTGDSIATISSFAEMKSR